MIVVTVPSRPPIRAILGADAPAVTMPGRTPVLVTVTLQGPQGPEGPPGQDADPNAIDVPDLTLWFNNALL